MSEHVSTGRTETIRRLFDELAECAPEERSERLKAIGNRAVVQEVAELLKAHDEANERVGALDELHAFLALREGALLGVENNVHKEMDPLDLEGTQIGHYAIEEYLGGGGMGVVYKARDTRLGRSVALKFLPPHLAASAGAKERFIREAKAASALDHLNICTIHEIGETSAGQLFIVMPFYEGETLKAKIARGPLPVEEAVSYAIQIAKGFSQTHEAGIVHRDVKPANVMVKGRGTVKLVDFGLAKAAGLSDLTRTGRTLGTVAYMSPEQARGKAVDARTDLWSLGVVLYEMITGERPFKGDHPQAVIYAIGNDEPTPMGELRDEVPAALQATVERCLEKNPEERYQIAEEVLADLRSLREQGQALPPEVRRTFTPASRRDRAVLYGGVALLLLMLVGLGYLLGGPAPEAPSTPVPFEDRPSIAVLPLENRSGAEEQAYFAGGMTDELTAVLTKIEGLRVVPRQSVMHVKATGQPLTALARRLKVGYFVDGSVLWAGDEVRITVNLIDPVTETTLWGGSFVSAQRDVLALQQEVARAMVQKVEVQLTLEDEARLGQVREVDPRAYELYRQADLIWSREPKLALRVKKVVPYLEQVIAIDSTYAPAYNDLAEQYMHLEIFNVLPWEETKPQVERYLTKALELDDTLPAAYGTKALFLQRTGDWIEAEEAYRHWIELDPGDPEPYCSLALLMFRTGRPEEGRKLARYALGLDPVNTYAHQVNVESQIFLRQYDEAIASSRKMLEFHPGHWIGYWGLGRAYLGKGLLEQALAVFEEMVVADSSRIGHLGYAYGVMGRREDALKLLEGLKARHADLGTEFDQISRIYTALGEREQALDWLEQNALTFDYYKSDPAFDALRSEPRFQALLEKMGLDALETVEAVQRGTRSSRSLGN